MVRSAKATLLITPKLWCALRLECHGALPTLENDICLFLGKYRVVSALFGKIERLTFTGTFDAFQHLVKSHSFKQICFPHRSEMGGLKSFLRWLIHTQFVAPVVIIRTNNLGFQTVM